MPWWHPGRDSRLFSVIVVLAAVLGALAVEEIDSGRSVVGEVDAPLGLMLFDTVGDGSPEIAIQTRTRITVLDRRLDVLYETVLPDREVQPPYRQNPAIRPSMRMAASAVSGYVTALAHDWDGDGKADLVVPDTSGHGFVVISGTGDIIDRSTFSSEHGRFALVVPAWAVDGILYSLVYGTTNESPRGIVAWDIQSRRELWMYHLPSDPFAIRPAGDGFAVSLATPVRGMYEKVGRDAEPYPGIDGSLHLIEIGPHGDTRVGVPVLRNGRRVRGVFLNVGYGPTRDTRLLVGDATLVVDVNTGVAETAYLSVDDDRIGMWSGRPMTLGASYEGWNVRFLDGAFQVCAESADDEGTGEPCTHP